MIALALSSLNAIMGCARSLYMMALDGQGPRIFGKVNKHNVPNFSMGLNTVLNILLIFVGAPGSIYVLSNVGYVGSFIPVLLGYYFLRRWRPEVFRPFKLPEWMKYGAIALAIVYCDRVAHRDPGVRDRGMPAGWRQDVRDRRDRRARSTSRSTGGGRPRTASSGRRTTDRPR